MTAIFVGASFLSAALVLSVLPMVAKQVLGLRRTGWTLLDTGRHVPWTSAYPSLLSVLRR